jgi:hypothetical protein
MKSGSLNWPWSKKILGQFVTHLRSIWCKAHYDVTDENNNVSSEGLNRYYHIYPSLSYRIRWDISTHVYLNLQNWRYSMFIICRFSNLYLSLIWPLMNSLFVRSPTLTNNGLSWSLSYCGWIYNYLCNQCLSPLKLWVLILLMGDVLDTTLCDKVCQWLAASQWFSTVTLVPSTNKTDRHREILLKVV